MGRAAERCAPAALAALLLNILALCGCTEGVRWEIGRYQDVQPQAKAANKLTFVYFRSWISSACGRFEEDVLKHPDVLTETRTMVCVPLEVDYDKALAEQWHLTAVPAYVIVDPEQHVLVRDQAPVTIDTLLNGIRTAKAKFYGTNPPPATRPFPFP